MARLNKPIGKVSLLISLYITHGSLECFFSKDGKYYYAGRYKAFRLDDLTTKEWEALSNEVRPLFSVPSDHCSL